MSTKTICPNCKCEETSWIGYYCPAQAICSKCNTKYEFGFGIRLLGLAEGIKRRPQMYEKSLCKKCNKYKIEIKNIEELSEEDKQLLCTCERN